MSRSETELMGQLLHKNIHYNIFNESNSTTNIKRLSVVWKNLTVTAKLKESYLFKSTKIFHKEIIHNVSGVIKPSSFVAILGSSGSGKSTLMLALSNRIAENLQVTGDIFIGKKPINDFTRYLTGFVYQDDLFLPILTVTEHLNFTVSSTAKLRFGKEVGEEDRINLLHRVLQDVGLLDVAHNRIGSSYANEKLSLSGGERKRLSIATELLINPDLLFCDEPTTGLDSSTALNIVLNLKYLVNKFQKSVICSIHQPNEKIFSLFSQIILLSNGKIVFNGTAADALGFFKSHGYVLEESQNPADYLIQVLSGISNTENLVTEFEKREYYSPAEKYDYIENDSSEHNLLNSAILQRYKKYNISFWYYKLVCVTHRNFLSIIRDSFFKTSFLGNTIASSALLGVIFNNSVTPTQYGLQALKGIVIWTILRNFFHPIAFVLNYIPKHLLIFNRECANNTNTPFMFYLSNVLSVFPRFVIEPIVSTAIIYWLSNLQNDVQTIIFSLVVLVLFFNVSGAFGFLLSILFQNTELAIAILHPIEQILFVSSCVFIKLTSIPWFLQWIRYLWYEGAAENLFIVQIKILDNITCYPASNLPCLKNSTEILTYFELNEFNLWPNILRMCIMYFIIHVVAYLVFLYRIRSRTIIQ